MIEDCVDVDSDAHCIASVDHVPELLLVATSADEVVGNWLVSLVPRSVWVVDQRMLIGRRDLDSSVAFWREESFALGSDAFNFSWKRKRLRSY